MTRNGLSVAIVRDPADTLAASPPVVWACAELAAVLARRGIHVGQYDSLEVAPNNGLAVVASDVDAPIARAAWARSAERPGEAGDQHVSAGARLSRVAEGLALLPWSAAGRDVTLAAGADARGLVYALLELADRVATATTEPLAGLRLKWPMWQQPANPIRGVARLFSSQVEDLGWFRDRACDHRPPAVFQPGQPLRLVIDVRLASAQPLDGVDLHYRRVNQAETYDVVRMRADQAGCFEATIPGAYTDTAYPLQYFFVLRTGSLGWRFPDLAADLANQPYFVVGTLERGQVEPVLPC